MEGKTNQTTPLDQLEATLREDDTRALSKAKLGVGLRVFLIVFVVGYMTWLFGALSNLDAEALTEIAANSVAEQLPEFRSNLQEYAIAQAPMVTDMARDTLLQVPAQMRQHLQQRLVSESNALIARFEDDVNGALGEVLDQQMAAFRESSPGDSPEAQFDALILGVSGEFRSTMIAALDELYNDYSSEVRRLNDHLLQLQRGLDLSESEELDKQLLEVWMTLIHKHGVGDPLQIAQNLERGF